MHFDAVPFGIVEGVVLEGGKIEIGAEFAIDAHQQIEIELGGDALGIVIGAIKNVGRLVQIDADDQHRPGAEDAAGVAQEGARLMRLEIADGRAGKKARRAASPRSRPAARSWR